MPEQRLYTAAQTRELDRIAIEGCGIPGSTLMNRAGHAAFELIQAQWPEGCPLAVFCGTGNNGGDGFVVAALAQDRRIPVTVYQVGDPGKIGGDAASARQVALDAGVDIQPFDDSVALDSCLVVDALLGTGLSGDVRGDYRDAIACVNACGQRSLATRPLTGLCKQDRAKDENNINF